MHTKNIFTQKDPIADAIAQIAEGDYKAKMEELKGQQHKIDKNKNNKIDAQDFAILRGKKKTMKEEEQVEEGWDDMMKAAKERSGPQPSGGSGVKLGSRYGGGKQKDKPEQDDDKKKVKEEVEQVDEVYDAEHMKYINTKDGDKHFEAGYSTMMNHIGDDFQKVNARSHAVHAFKKNPHKKGTPEHKAWHHGADAAKEEHISSLDEAAKWRSTSVAKKVTDPDGEDSVSYDYHQDYPKSTGMKKATSDTPEKYGSLFTRTHAQVASHGARKGMITKQHAERLKARIKAGMNNEEVEQIDEASYSAKAARAGKDIGKPGKMFGKIAKKAAARYGSMVKGKKVAGALLAKLRNEETDYEPLLINQIMEDTMGAIEQLDELKKATVKSYIKKKMDQVYKTDAPPSMSHVKKTMTNLQRAHDRNTGVKATSEEVESKSEKKDDVPFDGPYTKKKSAKAGKYGQGYSTARHLARQGMKKAEKSVKEEVEQIDERSLTAGETAEKERIVKGMKKGMAGFKARYGERAKSVMYATATARAKK